MIRLKLSRVTYDGIHQNKRRQFFLISSLLTSSFYQIWNPKEWEKDDFSRPTKSNWIPAQAREFFFIMVDNDGDDDDPLLPFIAI